MAKGAYCTPEYGHGQTRMNSPIYYGKRAPMYKAFDSLQEAFHARPRPRTGHHRQAPHEKRNHSHELRPDISGPCIARPVHMYPLSIRFQRRQNSQDDNKGSELTAARFFTSPTNSVTQPCDNYVPPSSRRPTSYIFRRPRPSS